ncbi:serine/threonine protein kinase [Myxococcus qinghaiensis]|uniref:serine/threonine protein kinase n=1 Tax=Myxococcus qinghaiensis TaxID=2906758 RepID=UPI0020A703CF|nr:protein kinase [Myxococcus qinghaiensis]MCP3166824.1 protein kinase [Myxococcus qinghaiensis]
MERVQAVAARHEDEAAPACVVCEAALEGARCGHCGAAMAPGGYRVLRLISQSPHGRVYLAVDGQGTRVALKELLFALVPGVEQLDAFEREAAVLRSLEHPDIPRFVASFKEGSGVGTRLYLAQELLEGETLLERISRSRLDEAEAWTLAEQVLQTLSALHRRTPALVHRDVKPANLILKPDGRVALVDFGAARHLARDVTHGSTLVGTFGYMPPEQLGGTVEPSSDLYALGATLVHALSGREPADLVDEGLVLSFEQHLQVSEPLRVFLGRLLAPKRSGRFASAVEALSALRASVEALAAGRSSRVASAAPDEGAKASGEGRGGALPRVEAVTETAATGVGAEAGALRDARGRPLEEAAVDGASVPVAGEAAEVAQVPPSSATEAMHEDTKAPRLSARRRKLRWALAALSATGMLLGVLRFVMAQGGSAVMVTDSPDWGRPTQAAPPAQPAMPPGTGTHRNFRTPWSGESGSR